jgi:CheY-like chemotaxis protein
MGTVLLVMKRPGNVRVMKQALEPLGFAMIAVSSDEELDSALAASSSPCLGLVDVSGFGTTIWRMCETLRSRGVRFVVLSAAQDAQANTQSLKYGASSVLQKPVGKFALLQLLHSMTG